jgi:transcriptional regulator with XRE-family HTH domain
MSQEALAARIPVSSTALREWFADRADPKHENLESFCAITGVSMDWIKTGQGEPLASANRDSGQVDLHTLRSFLRTPTGREATGAEIARLMDVLRLMGGALGVEDWEAQLRLVRKSMQVEAEREDPRKGDLGGYTAVPDDE